MMDRCSPLFPIMLTIALALSACQPLISTVDGTVPPVSGTIPPDNGTIPTLVDDDSATAPTGDLNATLRDNGAWVTLLAGETLAVTLESNRTTGYSWQVVEIDPPILAQQGEAIYLQPSTSAAGQGGSETFLFVATDTGETTLQLVYKRAGETGVTPTPEQLYTLNIIVEEAGTM